MANKHYALQKDVFDINKITVVGNPSISDDGFISNCSGSDYAKINNPITSVLNKFQVDCTIPIGTGVPFVIYIGNNAKMFFWRTANNKLQVVLRSTTTELLNITVDVPETSLNIKCIIQNNTCLANVNGEILINEIITTSAFFEMLNSADYFTFGSDIGNNPFNQPLDLKTFKIYVDNQLVFQPVKPTYLLERRKPKVWNKGQFNIVGNPSISESGIASGFSYGDYVKFPNIDLSTANSFDIISPVFYGYQKNSEQLIVGIISSDIIFKLIIAYNNYLGVRLKTSSSSTEQYKYSGLIAEDGQQYQLRVTFDGTQYKFYVRNISDDWGEPYSTYNSTEKISTNDSCTYSIGGPNAAYVYSGQGINLKQFKIYTDNTLVFDGGAETYVYDPKKFAVVGSLTITEYGVASGFSSSNYIRLPLLKEGGQVEKIRIKFNLLGSVSTVSRAIARLHETSLMIYTNNIGNINVAQPPSFGTQYFFDKKPKDYYADCIIEFILNKNSKELFVNYYENDVLIYSTTVSSTMPSLLNISSWADGATNSNGYWYLGYQGLGGGFSGSIDLPSISITSDSKEVFTGAKENYYMLRR